VCTLDEREVERLEGRVGAEERVVEGEEEERVEQREGQLREVLADAVGEHVVVPGSDGGRCEGCEGCKGA